MAEDQRPVRRPSFAARLLGGSARSARAVAEATGIDDAVDLATEEAIVRALESPAVERALVRVLEGPAVEEAVERMLASPAVERAAINALDSPLVDKVWDRLLQSDEAQKLVERVAEAPEVRAAITQQGFGLLEDIGRQIRRIAHRLDGGAETFARRISFRGDTRKAEQTDNAGLVTRALAIGVDGAVVAGIFFAATAIFDFAVSAFVDFDRSSTFAIVLGTVFLIGLSSTYFFFFWTLTGQTPGMRFLGIRLDDYDGTPHLSPRTAIRRLIGMVLAAIPLGAGYLVVLWSDRRRGLHDRIARTEVILVNRKGDP
ncbi:MAG TPA: RDD family protein, partial [Solirubrobacterales bacterium]|nr:RDD family protein [Solirubrobacterales bacterium]